MEVNVAGGLSLLKCSLASVLATKNKLIFETLKITYLKQPMAIQETYQYKLTINEHLQNE